MKVLFISGENPSPFPSLYKQFSQRAKGKALKTHRNSVLYSRKITAHAGIVKTLQSCQQTISIILTNHQESNVDISKNTKLGEYDAKCPANIQAYNIL